MGTGQKDNAHDSTASGDSAEEKKSDREIASMAFSLIEPLCEAEGIELVHAEYQRESGGRILRLYIDKPDGVTLDDCVDISRQAGDVLDVGFETDGSYHLEVSSPGVDRPLVKLADFDRFKGEQVKIRTARMLDGQKNFTGTLLGVSNEDVKVSLDNRVVAIPFKEIKKARLVG